MIHGDAVNIARLLVSEAGGLPLQYNTGALEDASGRVVKFGLKGASDVLACYQGRFLAIEVKVGRDRQRPEQARFQAAVERAGGKYILARWPGGEETVRLALSQGDGRQDQAQRIEEDYSIPWPVHDDEGHRRPGRARPASDPDTQGIRRDHCHPSQHEGG